MNTLHSLFDWTLDASLRASLMSLAVLLIQAALGQHLPGRWRYALWLPVLLVLVVPVLPESRWSLENMLVTKAPSVVALADASPALPMDTAISAAAVVAAAAAPASWKTVAAIVWAVGVLSTLVTGLAAYGAALLRFRRTTSTPEQALVDQVRTLSAALGVREPRLLISSEIESPAVAGMLRPLLLLPAGFPAAFTPAEATLVLKHELMHLKRHDLQVNLLVCVVHALHWFNPLLWLAASRSRQDRETACDAQVLASALGDCRNDYGHALLKVQSAYCPRGLSVGFVGIFQHGHALQSRIKAIAHYRRAHPLTGLVVTALMIVLTALGATRADTAAPTKKESETAPSQTASKTVTPAPGAMPSIEEKLQKIVFPHLKFVDAKPSEVIEFLQINGRNSDPTKAVNIIARMDEVAKGATLTFTLQNVTLGDALRKYAEMTGQTVRITSYAVLVSAGKPAPPQAPAKGKEEARAATIIIPWVEFKDATLDEAVEFFRSQALKHDPAKKGVDIVLKAVTPPASKLTLSLREVPLLQGLRYSAELCGFKIEGGEDTIVLSPKDAK